MTKKHFITIAAVLANAPTGTLGSENTRDYIGRQLALIFLEANPRFDADRFLAAADITLRSFPVNVDPTPAEQRDVCDRLLKRGPYAKGGR